MNDASSLIIFRFATIAAATGQFIWMDAAGSFIWMCIGGVGIGVLIGYLFLKMHKFLPTDANTDMVLSLIAPFAMYLGAEELGASGVLGVVSGGLFLSYRNHDFLSSSSRLRAVTVWESFTFLLNGIVFMMIGLDLPEIVSGLGDTNIYTAIGYGVAVTAVLVVVRIFAGYAAVITTLVMRNFITVADPEPPGWKTPLIIGWTGMRGVVSLAAALSIPLFLEDGSPFPQRNLILFITFVVILLTLVIQGLTLPVLLKKFPPEDRDFIKSEKEITSMNNNGKRSSIKTIMIDIFCMIILIAIDQFTKYLAVIFLKDKPAFPLMNGVLELNYLENRGAAFGMMQNQKWFFVFIAAIIIGVIIFVLYKTPQEKKYNAFHAQLVCIAAGAVGNMIDRIRLDYVVDFIYFSCINFPIFNFADMCVTIGTIVLVILILFVYKENDLSFLGFHQKKYREIK